jgi:hypothetical protein
MEKGYSLLPIFICLSLYAGETKGNYYADANREIFLLPNSAAVAGSDMAINRSAAPLSNAACLPSDSMKELSLAYAGYFQNTYSTGAISYIGPVDRQSCIGVSASYIFIPGIEIYNDTVVPVNVPTKTSSDFFFRISYGRVLMRFNKQFELTAGAAINTERLDLIGWTGYGIGADAGLSINYHSRDRSSFTTAGILLENLTTNYTHWSSEYKEYAYPHLRMGLGWQKQLAYIYGKFGISYCTPDLFSNEGINRYGSDSLDNNNNTVESPGVQRFMSHPFKLLFGGRGGMEYTVMNTISFRVGVDMKDGTISFGGGLRLFNNRTGFDFAYLDHDLASTYKLSVHYKWY